MSLETMKMFRKRWISVLALGAMLIASLGIVASADATIYTTYCSANAATPFKSGAFMYGQGLVWCTNSPGQTLTVRLQRNDGGTWVNVVSTPTTFTGNHSGTTAWTAGNTCIAGKSYRSNITWGGGSESSGTRVC